MSISTVTNRVAYQGNGSSAVFNFGFMLQSPSDLAVFMYNSSATAPQIITPLVLNTGYTFSGTANASGIYPSGGDIILNSSPNPQTVMVIFRSSVVTNSFFVSQDGKISSTGLNNELDKLTMLAQRAQDLTTRSMRLPDGFFGTFDTTLPANVALQPGKQIIINSSANGFALGNDIANYLPNMLLIASGTSVIASLPGATAGLVLISSGSSAPVWGALSLGSANVSAGSITGTLSVGNGGTGTGTSYLKYGLIFASSEIQFGAINTQVTPGFFLAANSSSPPSFQAFSAANVNSGVLSTAVGGTGTGSSYNQFGVVFGEAGTKLASTGPGGGDVPLVGNAGLAPSFRPLNLASGSSVTGTLSIPLGGTGNTSISANQLIVGSGTSQMFSLPGAAANTVLISNGSSAPSFQSLAATLVGSGLIAVANGGTGVGSLSPQYGVIYASSTTQAAVIPSAASGTVLTANGSSAPTFQTVTVSPIAPSTKVANYAATTSDALILCASSAYTVNLYPATGNAGRTVKIRKTSAQTGSSIIISETSLITALHTQNEQLECTSDGASWIPVRTGTETPWVPWTSTVTGFGILQSSFIYSRRSGPDLHVRGTFAAGVTTGVTATMSLGFGGVDGGVVSAGTSSIATGGLTVGYGFFSTATAATLTLWQAPNSGFANFGIQYAAKAGFAPALGTDILVGSQVVSFFATIPIVGWNP